MIKKLLGHVAVDSGQLIITDPCYIDSEWEKKDFKDIRIYKHKTENKLFGYLQDKIGDMKIESFDSYEQEMSTKKTLNEMIKNKEVEEIAMPEQEELKNTYSYPGICQTTLKNENQINFKIGHEGVAVAFNPGYGDGIYPVYGYYNEDDRCIKLEIDCGMTTEQEKLINSLH